MAGERFGFAFDPRFRAPLRLAGVRPATAAVVVGPSDLRIRFGPWLLATPLDNISGVEVSGPYAWYRVIGPRLSLADRGVTFGTNTRRGVCVRFHEPVGALAGRDRLRHPGATVTVADVDGLVSAIAAVRGG
jgi:hypothetical protein